MKKRYSEEAQNFINAMNFFHKHQEEIDDEKCFFFEAWYKIIYAECSKIYSVDKIKKIRKQLLEECKEQVKQIEEQQKIGFDYDVHMLYKADENHINRLLEKIEMIEKIDGEQLLDIIVRSLFIPEEQIEILKEEKSILEHQKLKQLSYNGKKCVEGQIIDKELLKKIYNEIENSNLLGITKKVSELQQTNTQFQKLQEAKLNAKNIIYIEIIKIYRKKIAKIKEEIQNMLIEISKHKYKKYIDSKSINLERLKPQIEEDLKNAQKRISRFINPLKVEQLKELLSTIKGTIEHEKTEQKYCEKLEPIKKFDSEIYSKSKTSKNIEDEKIKILQSTGIIINNLNEDIIEMYINNFIKEIEAETIRLNDQIKDLATREEQNRINAFAKKLGMSIENTLKLLRNDDNMYICLYTYIFGNEIENNIDNPTIAGELLNKLDSKFQTKEKTLKHILEKKLNIKENTKALTETQRRYLKIPYKN